MAPNSSFRRTVIPALLAVGMLAIVVLAALTPNTGAVPAQSACQYNNCATPTQSSGLPTWAWILLALIVIAAIVAVLFLYNRRGGRRPPPEPVVTEAEAPAGGAPEASAVPEPEAAGAAAGAVGAVGAVGGASAVAAAGAPYVETPEDVGATLPPPVAPAKSPRAGAAAAAGAGAAAEEPNIDALMDELDRISSEILKKGGKGGPPSGGSGGGSPPADGA